MRILVVEDDNRTAKYLKQGLEENNFAVDLASNGLDGLHLATHEEYDLMVLDILLPEYDGVTILQKTRDKGINTPVIFLTAKDTTMDKIKGLDMGAEIMCPNLFHSLNYWRVFALVYVELNVRVTLF